MTQEYLKSHPKRIKRKYRIFRLSLLKNDICYWISQRFSHRFSWTRWDWWSLILEKQGLNQQASLYLGALPIQKRVFKHLLRDDCYALSKLGVDAVLSVVEPYELTKSGWVILPVTPEQWELAQIEHTLFHAEEYRAINLEDLREGAQWIHDRLSQGRSVYVHCKAGRGRSVLIVLCYLIKYHDKSVEEALKLLKSKRRQVKPTPEQIEAAKQFANREGHAAKRN